ncbi:N-acetylglucosamine-6-phosphate deacetylase [Histidinibacterium aquaticum]|uniref:N-acetylglucosamine-6-phosphate deacetylase n=1 Tax=Histidinibacterium aquaticum TaxID=2613962 RepID=A0A5J5GJ31_9RHOB|nr:N-acetylglucosamine-6-phosphate deacetylase [Histidinibacterium aquaticum]KAA9008050.1 N-acetylglucosamine-6-phosphate deacetylase [Histidinibacterium aquaticum]
MGRWIAPELLFDGERLLENRAIFLEGGHLTETGQASDCPGAERVSGLVTPGFVDLQVNGGGGALLNSDPSPAGIARIAEAHRRFGTVALLPTLITDAPDRMDRAADAVLACDPDTCPGLHLEGPHIAEARRGTHAARLIRPFDDRTLQTVQRLRAAGRSVMVTLAPETVAPEDIRRLADTGAIVSLGHSDATEAEVGWAIGAGARAVTHLFNAMSQMTGRAPGLTGAAIASELAVGLICDGHHVSDTMIALALRARPQPDSTFLVSDAMPTVGGPTRFELYGSEIHVENGKLVNAEGNLAGAHTTMAEGLARLVKVIGIDPERALRMAITTPACLIGRDDLAGIKGRAARDILHIGPDWQLRGPLAD